MYKNIVKVFFLNDIMKTNREYERKKTLMSGNKYRGNTLKETPEK